MTEVNKRRNVSVLHLMKNNPQLVTLFDIKPRLNPRDTYFGDSVNATCLSYDVKAGETIQYVDFTSLYPTVSKYDKYISQYFGIAQVDVLSPRHLYHPVFPYRTGGKLMFPLCRNVPTFEFKMDASVQIKIKVHIVRFVPQS